MHIHVTLPRRNQRIRASSNCHQNTPRRHAPFGNIAVVLMPVVEGVECLGRANSFQLRQSPIEKLTQFFDGDHVVRDEAISIEGREAALPTLIQERIHPSTQAA